MYSINENKFGKNREKLEKLINKEKIEKKKYNKICENNNIDELTPKQNTDYISVGNTNTFPPLVANTNVSTDLLNIGTKKIFNWLGIPTKFDEMIYYSKWFKVYDNLITIINFLIILLAFYDYELNFSYPRTIKAEYSSVRIIMITLAFISIFCVYRRYFMKNKWKNITLADKLYIDDAYGGNSGSSIENFLFEDDNLVIGGKKDKLLNLRFFFDVMINLVMPYPGVNFHISMEELDRDANKITNIDYLLSDFLYIFVLFRSLYIIRAFINYSYFSDQFAFKVCKDYKVNNNFRFAIKCLFKIYHIKLVLWVFFGSVLIFGFMLRIFERPFWVHKGRIEMDNFITPMWCTIITMLTIGYGDFSPLTIMGKIIVFFIGLWGVFISSLIIVCLHGLLDLSNDQFIVFTKVLKSRVAINFIESAFIFHKSKFLISRKNMTVTKKNYQGMLNKCNEFKNMRNESKSIYRSNGLLHYNMKLLNEMKKLNHRMDKLEIDIDSAKKKI